MFINKNINRNFPACICSHFQFANSLKATIRGMKQELNVMAV